MKPTQIKYFVISLPRTGTKSICKMAEAVGIKYSHAPSVAFNREMYQNKVRLFADTPLYAPSYIEKLTVSPLHKFIYIDREASEWAKSFERVNLHLNYNTLLSAVKTNPYMILDRDCLGEVFNFTEYDSRSAITAHSAHRNFIYSVVPPDRLLVYEFKSGWDPFCEFLNVSVPEMDLPHVNKNTMYDPL